MNIKTNKKMKNKPSIKVKKQLKMQDTKLQDKTRAELSIGWGYIVGFIIAFVALLILIIMLSGTADKSEGLLAKIGDLFSFG